MRRPKLTVIGSEEWCSFPELNIPAIKARVDSGAKTSAIHAFNIRTYKKKTVLWVSFEVHPLQDNREDTVRCEAEVLDQRVIKSSTGITETRYVIKTTMKLGRKSWDIELTLSNRDAMGYRMLLGREAMADKVLVNPSDSFCLGDIDEAKLDKLYYGSKRVNSGLKLALLASNPDLYSNQRLMEAAAQRGHEILFLNIKQCYMKLDAKNPQVHYRGGRILTGLDAVIPRIRPGVTFYGCALTRHFESMGVYSLNGSAPISQSRDKLFSLQLLLQSGLSIPTTGFANSPMDTNDLIDMVGGAPLIIKLLDRSQGTGVVLAETKKAAESVINAFKALNANLLVQEFVKESNGKDIRCFVIDGKVVASMERSAAPGDFRANIHKGGVAKAIKVTAEERRLAVKAAKVMGLKVAGVDIIRSNKGPLLLEVNSSPGLEGIEGATGRDIARDMILAIEKRLKWKPPVSDSVN